MIPSVSYLIVLVILGVLLPLNGILSSKRIKKFFAENPNSRMIFYKQTIVIQLILSALVFGSMAFNGDSIDLIGLVFLKQGYLVISLLTACILGGWILRIYLLQLDKEKLKKDVEKDAAVIFLLPTKDEEYHWSIGTSFAAGICEEIVFRGFLYWQLTQVLPIVPAILISNIVFGLVHYATGSRNASLAFAFGVLLSIVFLLTGSLWIPMLIHVLIDIYSMTKGRLYFGLKFHLS